MGKLSIGRKPTAQTDSAPARVAAPLAEAPPRLIGGEQNQNPKLHPTEQMR